MKSANVLEVVELGRDLFVRHIIRPPIKDHIINTILSLLHIERDGYVINRSAITNCVEALFLLSDHPDGTSVYKRYLEPEILRQSDVYYKAEAARLLETCDALEYLRRVNVSPLLPLSTGLPPFSLRQVQARFSEEQSRAHQYLSLQTSAPLQAILQDTLLTPHLQTLIDMASSGLNAMIDHDKLDDLSRLYQLFSLVPEGVPSLRRSLKASIQKRGTELNSVSMEGREIADGDAEDDPDPAAKGKTKAKPRPSNAGAHGLALALRWVEAVLQLKDKFDHVWEVSFKNNREIESGLNEVINISFICYFSD